MKYGLARLSSWLLCFCLLFAGAARVSAGPPMDPRAMSGIPRPDPQVPPGTITVRVLRGGFDAPAVGVEVTLEVVGPRGAGETRKATTDAQGRATLSGLEALAGGRAVAKVDLAGEQLSSQPIALLPSVGSRVMLVAGATAAAEPGAAGGAPQHGDAGGPEVPLPGTAFALPGAPAGQLTVGTFDLTARQPIAGIEVTLDIARPDGTTEQRKATSDKLGKVVFEGLLPPDLPEGTKFVATAVVDAADGPQRTAEFTMDQSTGMAVVLAKGVFSPEPKTTQHAGPPPVPGPRRLPGQPGTVRVHVVDPQGRDVPGQEVIVLQKDMAGNDKPFIATTGADGQVELAVPTVSDAFYMVQVRYSGAPYETGLFQMDTRDGVSVTLRVWPTTADISAVRSVVQFDVDGLENDLARVVQVQDVMVTGDEAFWPGPEFKLEGAEGATGFTLLGFGDDVLAHAEKAPYATLSAPIPPGKVTRLAVAYLLEHDGTAEVRWPTSLALIETSVFEGKDLELRAEGAKKAEHESSIPDKVAYVLGPRPAGGTVEFVMAGLPVRDPIYRQVALWGALGLGVMVVIAVVSAPRIDRRVRLIEQRDQLLRLLESLSEAEVERRASVIAALDRICRQIDVLAPDRAAQPASKA